VLAFKTTIFTAAVSCGVFAAAFGVCGALRSGAVSPPALPVAALAPAFGAPNRLSAVTTPLPAMPATTEAGRG
jgi:hypothetical protein